jgi:hypothetical protein
MENVIPDVTVCDGCDIPYINIFPSVKASLIPKCVIVPQVPVAVGKVIVLEFEVLPVPLEELNVMTCLTYAFPDISLAMLPVSPGSEVCSEIYKAGGLVGDATADFLNNQSIIRASE